MPVGEKGPQERGGEIGAPLLKTLFCRYWLV